MFHRAVHVAVTIYIRIREAPGSRCGLVIGYTEILRDFVLSPKASAGIVLRLVYNGFLKNSPNSSAIRHPNIRRHTVSVTGSVVKRTQNKIFDVCHGPMSGKFQNS